MTKSTNKNKISSNSNNDDDDNAENFEIIAPKKDLAHSNNKQRSKTKTTIARTNQDYCDPYDSILRLYYAIPILILYSVQFFTIFSFLFFFFSGNASTVPSQQ